MEKLRQAFDIRLGIQIVVMVFAAGVAWGAATLGIEDNSRQIASLARDVDSLAIITQRMTPDVKENTAHRNDENVHMPLQEKLEIFVAKQVYEENNLALQRQLASIETQITELRREVLRAIGNRPEGG